MSRMVRTGEDGPKGISCLVIEKDMPGVSRSARRRRSSAGIRSRPRRSISTRSACRSRTCVGGEGEGFRIAMMGLDGGRLNIGACSLGGAQRCLDEAITYTKERKQFGQPIADFQNTQFTLADMETELQAARTLLYVAGRQGHRERARQDPFAAMAKRLATDTGSSVVDRALQLHGGYGYLHGLSDRALLARPARPLDPRRHQPGHAHDRRPRPAAAVSDDGRC